MRMIAAELKGIYTATMGKLEDFNPEDYQCFQIVVRAMVGPRRGEGEESFDIKVCTPQWLAKEVAKYGFVVARHYLFVPEYDPTSIKRVIKKFVERSSGESWGEVALKVARIGCWEFEDYPGLKLGQRVQLNLRRTSKPPASE